MSLETKRKQQPQRATLALLLLGFIATTTVLNTSSSTLPQTTTAKEPSKRKDISKVLMTVQGLDHNGGDIVTIVTVNGESRVKLFDDTKTYIRSINADGTGGIVEYAATFPNMTVNVGDEYKLCALAFKDSNLICQTGNNSPALRPEVIYNRRKPRTSQAATLAT